MNLNEYDFCLLKYCVALELMRLVKLKDNFESMEDFNAKYGNYNQALQDLLDKLKDDKELIKGVNYE